MSLRLFEPGESTAKLLARNGAKVVLGARRKDRIDALVKDITATAYGTGLLIVESTAEECAAAGIPEVLRRVLTLSDRADPARGD